MSGFDSRILDVINKLQDLVYNTIGNDSLDLPQISVIGSQSSGKSSVLENVVGKDFLPRGTGIVTRRPLILQLVNISEDSPLIFKNTGDVSKNSLASINNPNATNNINNINMANSMTLDQHLRQYASNQTLNNNPNINNNNNNQPLVNKFTLPNEWGEFLHLPGKRFYNFEDIKLEIENETSRIAGKNKGINRIPINLKIYSPNVLNLTLVDLPGITKVPIGDQPTDIEKQIRNLILEYISKPNSIILAVSPANVDLVNSEALKLARQVDPLGKRTIGVLSKLDLMDHGTNALDILSGRVYPLKLGFIGVVNRSQQDIMQNKSLEDSLRDEDDFFLSHPVYKNIHNKCGTKFLSKTLNHILMNHIRERLPDIKAKLNTLMGQTEQELLSYGDSNLYSKENRENLILSLMTKFATSFISSIDGNNTFDISTKELCGGARIYYIYNNVFGKVLKAINPTANLSTVDIRIAIRNSTGPRPSLFVPELAFDLLVKPQIKLLESPSHKCVELVYEELMKIVHSCGSNIPELARYPKFQTKLIEVVSDLLRERLGPTASYVESLINIHRAYINTNHPNFIGAAAAMTEVVEERKLKEQYRRRNEKDGGKPRKSIESHDVSNENDKNSDQNNGKEINGNLKNNDNNINASNTNKNTNSSNHNLNNLSNNGSNNNGSGNNNVLINGNVNNPSKKIMNIKDNKLRKGHSRIASGDSFDSFNEENSRNDSKDSFLNYFFGGKSDKDIINNNGNSNRGGRRNSSINYGNSNNENVNFNSGYVSSYGNSSNKSISSNLMQYNSRDGLILISNGELLPQALDDLKLKSTSDQTSISDITDREQLECELIRRLIISYFNIVRQMIEDQVPKAIMFLLVNYCKESVQNRLVSKLYKENLFDELLHEDENLAQEREKCVKLLQTYREASKIIGDITCHIIRYKSLTELKVDIKKITTKPIKTQDLFDILELNSTYYNLKENSNSFRCVWAKLKTNNFTYNRFRPFMTATKNQFGSESAFSKIQDDIIEAQNTILNSKDSRYLETQFKTILDIYENLVKGIRDKYKHRNYNDLSNLYSILNDYSFTHFFLLSSSWINYSN
ncbi:dynamin-related GTPase DNM1 ASCRUDRAFT_6132 [Ascoidea rubescens DSM 1968]|uniref:dynamin GTPase n=1 Tax=Ascoidea rubescens DSM 1968 TaxID=1344418 RepID=A0A1D2VRS7_9ASCO|nr:hypothetical protein ASCRUDRAFT_6132 [Ascoidea rubescens DSM 1968]ODV64288.1 hypothetical protein ASCRUDRAFT_6132 [Ascoidea rubescens DSM 1968]